MSSSDLTLDEDIWKDTFDKILEPRIVLRQLNIIKKDVNASYNINSSIENNSRNDSSSLALVVADPVKPTILVTKADDVSKRKRKHKRELKLACNVAPISTPVIDRLKKNPFKCSISPIGIYNFRYFPNENKYSDIEKFEATPIRPHKINEVIEYGSSEKEKKEISISGFKKKLSPLVFPIWNKKQNKNGRNVCFDIGEKVSSLSQMNPVIHRRSEETIKRKVLQKKNMRPQSLQNMQPGKWRKTLNAMRRTHHVPFADQSLNAIDNKKVTEDSTDVVFMGVIPAVGKRISVFMKQERTSDGKNLTNKSICVGDEWKWRVLKCCMQPQPKQFNDWYTEEEMQSFRKIGEGAYGEVFLRKNTDQAAEADTVLKIIPIEGKTEINGEIQKTFEEIMPEIIISMELCKLKKMKDCRNSTSGYVNLLKVSCIQGEYPKHLIKLWEEYDKNKGSENDHPSIFTGHQLYIALELSFSGRDLEGFQFNNAEQAFHALEQIILTLAVGEEAYQFEHRDLHCGNVLLISTNDKYLSYKLLDKELSVPTKGIKATIIDYTLSRMTCNDCCYYNDLSTDEELFTASGDYQFEIYRMMRDVLNNDWETFEPKTNIFWISYIIAKLLNGVYYKNKRSKVHATYIEKLKKLNEIILNFGSATECAKYLYKTIF